MIKLFRVHIFILNFVFYFTMNSTECLNVCLPIIQYYFCCCCCYVQLQCNDSNRFFYEFSWIIFMTYSTMTAPPEWIKKLIINCVWTWITMGIKHYWNESNTGLNGFELGMNMYFLKFSFFSSHFTFRKYIFHKLLNRTQFYIRFMLNEVQKWNEKRAMTIDKLLKCSYSSICSEYDTRIE